MVGRVRSVLTRPQSPARPARTPGRWLLLVGLIAFGVALGTYVIYMVGHAKNYTLDPVDFAVYRSGGLIVRHLRPYYNPHLASPLYDWVGYGQLHLPFTYTPFAGLAFAIISFVPYQLSLKLSVAVNLISLLAVVWFTLGGLGYRRLAVRAGATLLGTAAVLWTEPVLRTIYLGQVNLVLLALIMWDLGQPDTLRSTGKSRWWKGFGTGIAAGIKLTPLVFIPYLLVARKFRQAALALAGFVFSVLLGFVILPGDSRKWWFGGLFAQGGRTGFLGWAGNQSLDGLITRLAGSINAGHIAWIVIAVLVGVAGVIGAGLLDRKGHAMVGLLTAALTGLLISPVSWDHHWVWIVPGVIVAAHYAVQAWRRGARRTATACGLLAVAIVAWFGAWPTRWFGVHPPNLGNDSLGLLWIPKNTQPYWYQWYGDQRWFPEYHWHGLNLITGNAFILAGLGMFGVLLAISLLLPARKDHDDEPGRDPAGQPGDLRLPAA